MREITREDSAPPRRVDLVESSATGLSVLLLSSDGER
jgi:hypothetical protein